MKNKATTRIAALFLAVATNAGCVTTEVVKITPQERQLTEAFKARKISSPEESYLRNVLLNERGRCEKIPFPGLMENCKEIKKELNFEYFSSPPYVTYGRKKEETVSSADPQIN